MKARFVNWRIKCIRLAYCDFYLILTRTNFYRTIIWAHDVIVINKFIFWYNLNWAHKCDSEIGMIWMILWHFWEWKTFTLKRCSGCALLKLYPLTSWVFLHIDNCKYAIQNDFFISLHKQNWQQIAMTLLLTLNRCCYLKHVDLNNKTMYALAVSSMITYNIHPFIRSSV